MSLKYEPASEPLHILVLNDEASTVSDLALVGGGDRIHPEKARKSG